MPVADVEGDGDPVGRAARSRSRRAPGRRERAVPITTRSAPAARAAATASASRRPPATWIRDRAGGRSLQLDDRGDRVGLASLPRPRAVEVDDVDPAAPAAANARGHRGRVVAVDLLAVEVALPQPDDAAAAEVDRRQDVER